MRRALELIALYPAWVRQFVEEQLKRTADNAAIVNLLGLVGEQVVLKTEFVEEWFAEGSSLNIPLALVEAVERECKALGLGDRRGVLAVGRADNFGTWSQDLADYFFSNPAIPQRPPPGVPTEKFAMLQVPRLEGGEGLWWPIVIGHELAHLAATHHGSVANLKLAQKIDWSKFSVAPSAQAGFIDVAESWAAELICDAYTVHRFGPAGVASVVELLDHLGATEKLTRSHPPGWLRFRLLKQWLGNVDASVTASVLAHCDEIAASPMPAFGKDGTELVQFLESLNLEYLAAIKTWGPPDYKVVDREELVTAALKDLRHGIPPRVDVGIGTELEEEDAINAGWVEWTGGDKWPIGKLLGKSLDNLSFLRQWKEAGGLTGLAEEPGPAAKVSAVLSGPSIVERTARGWDAKDPLIVTPLLPHAVGTAALDVRLGPKFIVFQRTDTASIKTFNPGWDAREVQRLVEVGWGERFVLHPNELVLASTLEYLALPGDLSAQVITRSSYGRMGLITATAVQVHPHFHGVLTLELLNLGLVPLELMPGERIAQLVFMTVSPPAPPPKEEDLGCPVGPEFSRPTKQTAESDVLSKILKRAEARINP